MINTQLSTNTASVYSLAQKKISTKTVPTENRGMMKFYKCGDISKLGVDHAEVK